MLARFKNAKKTDGRTVQAGNESPLIEIPVTENDRGGFLFSAATLRDHQYVEFARTVFVPWDNKELKVEFSTFRDRLQPGQKERWAVKISSPDQARVPAAAAEILTYMYDRSLDAFVAPSSAVPHEHMAQFLAEAVLQGLPVACGRCLGPDQWLR